MKRSKMSNSRKGHVRSRSNSTNSLNRRESESDTLHINRMNATSSPTHNILEERYTSMASISEEQDDTESVISSDCPGMDTEFDNQESGLQIQEIWHDREILTSLQRLPGTQEIMALLDGGHIEKAAAHQHSTKSGLLLASWTGNIHFLEHILAQECTVNVRDNEGRTPLHLAASSGSFECVTLLLQHGAMTNVWDKERSVTPLHCAGSSGNLACLKALLDAGAIVDAGLSTAGSGRTPLHYAVQSNSVSCVQELLRLGASPNMSQVYTETPLHVAAGMGFSTCVKILLDHGADFRVQYGPVKSTPLHLAAEDGNAECARLLLDSGADINATNHKFQTPTHLAALAQSAKTLELLLARKADPNAEDIDKRTPLHSAIVKGSRSCECVQILLQYGAKVNAADIFGYTPVHIAALNEFSNCLKLLLDHGGDVTKKTNGHVSALSFIARRTPDILQYFERKLDQSIRLHDHEIGDVDCEIKLDFKILVPNVTCGETCLLLTFIDIGQRRILKHPLCQIFLFLKWKRIRKYFLLSLIIHALFVFLCSFLLMCEDFNACHFSLTFKLVTYILLLANFLNLAKEIFQIAHSRIGYIYQWENWLQWLIILTVFVSLIPRRYLSSSFAMWHNNIAALGMFCNWLELMVLTGRFPMFGLYVQMFKRGAVNFGKFLMAYCCLLAAFGFSFRMLFPKYKAFTNIFYSMEKVVMMMTGELEFEDIFYSTEDVSYPITTHLFFLIFTLLVTIVLTNLLVGLSVSDIQGLQKSAVLDRLVRQAELVAYMESMLFSRLLKWVPNKILTICQRSALLLSSPRQWSLIIRPNDPREKRIPEDLIKSAYKCVSEQRQANRGRYKRNSRHSDRKRSDRQNDFKYDRQKDAWISIS